MIVKGTDQWGIITFQLFLKGQLNKIGTQFTHTTSHMRLFPGRRRGMRGERWAEERGVGDWVIQGENEGGGWSERVKGESGGSEWAESMEWVWANEWSDWVSGVIGWVEKAIERSHWMWGWVTEEAERRFVGSAKRYRHYILGILYFAYCIWG
jgi:hypothetical protein